MDVQVHIEVHMLFEENVLPKYFFIEIAEWQDALENTLFRTWKSLGSLK